MVVDEKINKGKSPKILMIAPLPPPVHGSAMMTQYIKESKLINDKFDLDWINLSTSRSMTEIGKKSYKKIFRFAGSFFKTFFKLLTKRYKFCYLAITCHGGGFLKDAPFALLCKMFGYKLVIHQHNKGMAADADKPLFKYLLKKVYKDSTVILLSERLYPDISKIVKHEQVVICPNGIPKVKKYPHPNNQIPKLLFLSNLIESKGVLVLLDACKILKDKGHTFTCDFIGGETKEIDKVRFGKEVKDRGLDDVIYYLGPKYNEDKDKAFSESDIFVLPTLNECFPLVLLEAMQQGIPLVSTAIGGIPDIISESETGFISNVDNPQHLAQKIKILLDNPKLRKIMGEASIKRFNEMFSLNKFEEAISEILINIKTGGVKRISYLGRKYGEEKTKAIAQCDIFVFPTFYSNECFPLVLLEAMQQGKPIITSNEGGIPDIVLNCHGGYIVHSDDVKALADKISYLMSHKDLMSTQGHHNEYIFEKRYSIISFEQRIKSIFEEI